MADNTIIVDPNTTKENGTRIDMIPENLRDLLSGTSRAEDCFPYQRFSEKLQVFLIGYNNGVYSDYGVYL